MTIVLLRVELGIAYDQYTSKTAISMNSQRPIALASFPSKHNQTISIDVEAQASDDSYDTGLESKQIRHSQF